MLEEGGVLLDELFLLLGHIFEGVNRVGGAGRNTGAAVDAAFGIHIHLSGRLVAGLVLLGVDAIGGANLNAEGVLNAVISNDVGHDESISSMK